MLNTLKENFVSHEIYWITLTEISLMLSSNLVNFLITLDWSLKVNWKYIFAELYSDRLQIIHERRVQVRIELINCYGNVFKYLLHFSHVQRAFRLTTCNTRKTIAITCYCMRHRHEFIGREQAKGADRGSIGSLHRCGPKCSLWTTIQLWNNIPRRMSTILFLQVSTLRLRTMKAKAVISSVWVATVAILKGWRPSRSNAMSSP